MSKGSIVPSKRCIDVFICTGHCVPVHFWCMRGKRGGRRDCVYLKGVDHASK